MVKATASVRGLTVLPPDNDDKFFKEGTSQRSSGLHKAGMAMPGMAAKLLADVPSYERTEVTARKRGPTMAPPTRDNDAVYIMDVTSRTMLKP
jgi:hypothetical protein